MNQSLPCSTSCRSCGIRDRVLFGGLKEDDLLPIQSAISEKSLAPQAVLYHMGEKTRGVFTVRQGFVKLIQYLPDGGQRIVRLVRSGDVLGLEALLGQPYQHEAVVIQHAVLCRIPVEVVQRLAEESPALHRELMFRWQRALSEAEAWLTELSTGSVRRRVARLVLRLADEAGERCCSLFNRRDMGAMLGVTTESTSRVIAEFRRDGILQENPQGFCIDRLRLREIAAD